MSVLLKIAHFQNRRDEVPNQVLAKELAHNNDRAGIQEIAINLWHTDTNVQNDCLKVLYETAYLKPELVAEYVGDFIKLLKSKNNRLVWGSMIALATIAPLKADEISQHLPDIQKTIESGSVITVDNGIKTLAQVAAHGHADVFPYLLNHLATCRPKDVPQHAEKIVVAVNPKNKAAFIAILEKRLDNAKASEAARIRKVIKTANSV